MLYCLSLKLAKYENDLRSITDNKLKLRISVCNPCPFDSPWLPRRLTSNYS